MVVTFYRFSKRVNSTKRPSGGTSINVAWKDKTDMHRPTVKCQSSAVGQYNYMKIGDHYYWIVSEVVQPNNWIEWTGEVDSMATCADEIKSTTAFIERSESMGLTTLLDSLAPAQSNETTTQLGSVNTGIFSAGRGTYIVSVANYPLPMTMTPSQFTQLYNQLNSESIINQLENSIVRLSEIITGALWLPIETVLSQGTLELKAGYVTTGIVGDIVDNQPIIAISGITTSSGGILESSAYTDYYLYLPFVGAVQISPDQFKGNSLTVETTVDPTNGSLLYKVMNASGAIISTYGGTCGVPISVGSTAYNLGGAAATALGIVGSIATGNILGAVASGSALMFSGLKSVSAIGSGGGSRAALTRLDIALFKVSKTPPEALGNKASCVGLPTYRTASIGSVTGFVKCINASIEAAQELEVIETCNSYLNSGAYIE